MKNTRHGFTLIELSIVLVIIGLIVGGVLSGRELIENAQARQAIRQIESYNAAFSAFQGKYSGIPGDLHQSKAVGFGFSWATGQYIGGTPAVNPSDGFGDGDGFIECSSASAISFCGEAALTFIHLSEAKLIENSLDYNAIDPDTGDPIFLTDSAYLFATYPMTNAGMQKAVPALKGGFGAAYTLMYSVSGDVSHYYILAGINTIEGDGTTNLIHTLSATQSYRLDSKMDDGLPNQGTVMAQAGNRLHSLDISTSSGSGASDCVTAADATGIYNIAGAADGKNCHLQVRAQGF